MIRNTQIGHYVCAVFEIKFQNIRSWTAAASSTPTVVRNAVFGSFEHAGTNNPLTFEDDL
jgi:ribosomal protein S6